MDVGVGAGDAALRVTLVAVALQGVCKGAAAGGILSGRAAVALGAGAEVVGLACDAGLVTVDDGADDCEGSLA